ncbi:hypothetical protein IFM89_022923 [Coptis chinensis]|uniref:Uncharacterized protein n=1 Tax=Coptis chinensis TaxID=261450 RepID=A0A835IQL2_9MAGN|nr:hypothetical protein IFM89_022923 [Coptis chinensis]
MEETDTNRNITSTEFMVCGTSMKQGNHHQCSPPPPPPFRGLVATGPIKRPPHLYADWHELFEYAYCHSNYNGWILSAKSNRM